MHDEAQETEQRGTELADRLDGKKTAVLDKARETKGEATEMMLIYPGRRRRRARRAAVRGCEVRLSQARR
jgi:hypothetical protein